MDKNIVAFLRDDVRSIVCQFFAHTQEGSRVGKGYTYLTTDKTIEVGDIVVVFVGQTPKAVLVIKVDEELSINPDADKEYPFIVGKVDIDAYESLLAENKKLKELLATGYLANLRRSFQQAIFNSLDDGLKTQIANILEHKE